MLRALEVPPVPLAELDKMGETAALASPVHKDSEDYLALLARLAYPEHGEIRAHPVSVVTKGYRDLPEREDPKDSLGLL